MTAGPGEGDPMSKAFVKDTDDEGDLPDEPPAIPPGIKNYMTPEGHRHAERIAPAIADGAPESGGNRSLGGWKRRPVGERRLHLRQASPARDRSAHPIPVKAAGACRGGRPKPAEKAGPGLFWRDRHLRHWARYRNDDHHRRRR